MWRGVRRRARRKRCERSRKIKVYGGVARRHGHLGGDGDARAGAAIDVKMQEAVEILSFNTLEFVVL